MTTYPSLKLLALALALAACSGKGAESATATETTAATETSTVSSTSTEATTAETTIGNQCALYTDDDLFWPVAITLRNDGAAPVTFLHAPCGGASPVTIAGPDSDKPIQWTLGICEFTCNAIALGLCECPASCPADVVVILAPGGTYAMAWEGGVYTDDVVPDSCIAEGECAGACKLQTLAKDGVYLLHALGGSEVGGCDDPDLCTCTPNADGWCEVIASSVTGAPREASASIMYQSELEAILVFE